MLTIKIEKFLWPWEKRKFKRLTAFVKNNRHRYVSKIKEDMINILEGKYLIGEGGTHIWYGFTEKGSHKRLAIIHQ